MSLDWIRFAQEHIEHSFDRFRGVLEYRAPSILPISTKRSSAAVLTHISHTHGASATSPSA